MGPEQDGPDAVAIDLWAPDRQLFAALRVDGRLGGQPGALVVDGNEARLAQGPAVEVGDGKARVEIDGTRVEFQLASPTAAAPANAAGLRRSAQLYEAEGTVVRAGRSAALRGRAVQVRSWADDRPPARRRCVTAVTDDGALVHLLAVQPQTGTPHGDELVAGQVADPQSDNGAAPFEDVRLSTIYGPDGLPRSASAELYRPGDEWPSRLAGHALSGSVLELGGTGIAISFFEWTLVGRPGWGTYEIEPSP
jgi:hypothetical protein